eukprot:365742-Chlamydomonas_euryale.AAC.1
MEDLPGCTGKGELQGSRAHCQPSPPLSPPSLPFLLPPPFPYAPASSNPSFPPLTNSRGRPRTLKPRRGCSSKCAASPGHTATVASAADTNVASTRCPRKWM